MVSSRSYCNGEFEQKKYDGKVENRWSLLSQCGGPFHE